MIARTMFMALVVVAAASVASADQPTKAPNSLAPRAAMHEDKASMAHLASTFTGFAQQFSTAAQSDDPSQLISAAMGVAGWASQLTDDDFQNMQDLVTNQVMDFTTKLSTNMEARSGGKKFPGIKNIVTAFMDSMPSEVSSFVKPQLDEVTKHNPLVASLLSVNDKVELTEDEKSVKQTLDAVMAMVDDWMTMASNSNADDVPVEVQHLIDSFQKGESMGVTACEPMAHMGDALAETLNEAKTISSLADIQSLLNPLTEAVSTLHVDQATQMKCLSPTGKPEDASVMFVLKQVLSLPQVHTAVVDVEDLAGSVTNKIQAMTTLFSMMGQ